MSWSIGCYKHGFSAQWENEVGVPVPTVSEAIALHCLYLDRDAYVTPNVPCTSEIDAVGTGQLGDSEETSSE